MKEGKFIIVIIIVITNNNIKNIINNLFVIICLLLRYDHYHYLCNYECDEGHLGVSPGKLPEGCGGQDGRGDPSSREVQQEGGWMGSHDMSSIPPSYSYINLYDRNKI